MCKSAFGISWLLYVSNGFEIVVAVKEFFDNGSKGPQRAPAAPPPVPQLRLNPSVRKIFQLFTKGLGCHLKSKPFRERRLRSRLILLEWLQTTN